MQHQISATRAQVIDFIEFTELLRKRAVHRRLKQIKDLAALWAGCSQSYPQMAWKGRKLPVNQGLGGELEVALEDPQLTDSTPPDE